MRLSICQLISTGGLYGAERVLIELSAFLVAQGHDCHVLVLESPGAQAVIAAARHEGIDTNLVPCRGSVDLRALRLVRHYLAEHGIQVVHSHGYRSDFWLWLARARGVAKVATAHGWCSDTPVLRVYEAVDKWCLRRFDQVIVVSPTLLQQVRRAGVAEARSVMIENGLSFPAGGGIEAARRIRRELAVPESGRLVVRVGRLDSFKGNHILLRAFAEVAPGRDVRLLFVGDGPDREPLGRIARDYGVGAQVIFAGYRTDVADILRASDLFVISSLQEGLPMVLLEAMAARVPIVTTSVGAIASVIRSDENGWLVPPNDTTALALALRRVLDDPGCGRRVSDQAFVDHQQRYTREAMGRRYVDLYARLAGRAA